MPCLSLPLTAAILRWRSHSRGPPATGNPIDLADLQAPIVYCPFFPPCASLNPLTTFLLCFIICVKSTHAPGT